MKPRPIAIITATLTALTFATLLVFIATPLHTVLFALVPADGAVTSAQRMSLDASTVQFLLTGNRAALGLYSAVERSHLADVRVRVWWDVCLMLISTLGMLMLRPTAAEWRRAAWWVAGGVLAVSVLFQPLFILMHQVLFPGGNWELPSSQFVITRVYPLGFFVGAWLLIGVIATGSLWGLSKLRK